MSIENDFSSLRRSSLSASLTDDEVEALAVIAYCRRLADQEVLIKEGNVDNSLHIITEGAIAVTRDVGKGEYTTIHVLRTGDLAGEMGFISGQSHTATLRSLGRTQVCSFEREAFESLLAEHPWLVYRVMQNIVKVSQDILRRMNAQHVELTKYVSRSHALY
ncbi:putative transcriptional regulator, Crp/Fnr family [Thiorhodococcus drewsii AZ1]|uniref:Putative transcriptional regulator, Crp/Fnr family n=1 Tax=Thiorhodococcus drewsii AZ1 TaxID=765913 RepID=G2E4Y8_9GAMM|nr:cyclic nucleotide-binding domain-containing protein [Thiorhodococcus drewsii]EGV29159.1 putative transcriptional regulator, Crp/Fnr family [Thiorhodococcus drewsii AZ1]